MNLMEKKIERLWKLFAACYSMGLITPNQMSKGFGRVADCMDDLVLDVPDVEKAGLSNIGTHIRNGFRS